MSGPELGARPPYEPVPMTARRLRAALQGVPDHAWVVCRDENGHWTPTTTEFLPSTPANERAQIVLSDEEADNA